MPSASQEKKPGAHPILGFMGLMAILAGILLFKTALPDKEYIARVMQQVAAYVADSAADAGREAKFTYGEIKTEGFAYDKYMALDDLHFSLSDKSAAGTQNDAWSVTIPELSVVFDPLNNARIIFKLSDSVSILENGRLKSILSFPSPLKLGYFNGTNPAPATLITIRLPDSVSLIPPPDAVKQPPLTISYDENPELSIKNLGASHEQEQKFEVRNITVQKGNEVQATIGAIAHYLDEKPGKDNRMEGEHILTISDFSLPDKAKTCSLTSHINYLSDVSLMNAFGLPLKGNVDVKLDKLLVACDDFKLRLEGNFSRLQDDPLPSGLINVTIENVKAFLASDLIEEQTRKELALALPKITGKPLDTLTDATLSIKRNKNGTLMLGAITADEAGISGLTDRLKTPHLPAEPVRIELPVQGPGK